MGFIFAILGGLGSLLLIPAGFTIGVYVPLIVTDVAYQLYNVVEKNALYIYHKII